jgi:hypothetical protein
MHWGNRNLSIRIHTVMGQAITKLANRQLTPDELRAELTKLQEYFDQAARQDELLRIKAATLDAESDVWSLTNDGEIVSLNDRVEELDEQI